MVDFGLLHCSSDYSRRSAPLCSGLAVAVFVTSAGLCCLFLEQRDICHPHWVLTDATFKQPALVWTQSSGCSVFARLAQTWPLPLPPPRAQPFLPALQKQLSCAGMFWRLELQDSKTARCKGDQASSGITGCDAYWVACTPPPLCARTRLEGWS